MLHLVTLSVTSGAVISASSVGSLVLPAFLRRSSFIAFHWRGVSHALLAHDVPRLLLPSEHAEHFQTMPHEVSFADGTCPRQFVVGSLLHLWSTVLVCREGQGSSPRQFCILASYLAAALRPTICLPFCSPTVGLRLAPDCLNKFAPQFLVDFASILAEVFLQPLHWLLCRGTLSLREWSPRSSWICLSVLSHGRVLCLQHRLAKHCLWRDWKFSEWLSYLGNPQCRRRRVLLCLLPRPHTGQCFSHPRKGFESSRVAGAEAEALEPALPRRQISMCLPRLTVEPR